MSVRTCCCQDENKPHLPDCPKEVAWRKKQGERVRQTDFRKEPSRKGSKRRDSKR